jgi:hypothetical protein
MKKPTKLQRHNIYKEVLKHGSHYLDTGFCLAFLRAANIDVYDDEKDGDLGLSIYPEIWKYRPANYEPGDYFDLTKKERVDILKEAIRITKPKKNENSTKQSPRKAISARSRVCKNND